MSQPKAPQCIHGGPFPCAQCLANSRHKNLTEAEFERRYLLDRHNARKESETRKYLERLRDEAGEVRTLALSAYADFLDGDPIEEAVTKLEEVCSHMTAVAKVLRCLKAERGAS